MGLFGSNKNQKMLRDALQQSYREGNIKTKRVKCPKCGRQYTVTAIGTHDTKTCSCGYRISI